jgi:AcrR family transcriptional regulator
MAASTSAERGREVRQRLLTAAATLIADVGWSAVSTRMIAERAGVAPGVVHYHFASVQALLAEAALSVMRGSVDDLGTVLDEALTPLQIMELMLGALDQYSGQDTRSILFVEAFLAATRDEELRGSLAQIVEEFRQLLAERLARAGLEAPDATAVVLAAAVDGLVLRRALNPGLTASSVMPVVRRLLLPPPAEMATEPVRRAPAGS